MTQTPNSGCKPDLDGTRILVAEDEAVIAMMVEDSSSAPVRWCWGLSFRSRTPSRW
ncbi:hypothetical protein [Teichococcus aestuarii]|uniref:hypothetical protein n=1 Tax=Teichococcus aestuarii TaxID=568898 RepID=UPI003622D3CB